MAMVITDQGAEFFLYWSFTTQFTVPTNYYLGLLIAAPTTASIDGDSFTGVVLGNNMKITPEDAAYGGSVVAPKILLNSDGYTNISTTPKKIAYVEWRAGGSGTGNLVDYTWNFTDRLRGAHVGTLGTDSTGAYGGIHGYVIEADPAHELGGNPIMFEIFQTPFIPEAGASLKITPKIYLGNVGDF